MLTHDPHRLCVPEWTHSADGVHTIISAETTPTKNSRIYVWRYVALKRSSNRKPKDWKWYRPLEIVVQLVTQLAMVIGVLVFLSQYFGIGVSTYSLNEMIDTHTLCGSFTHRD